MKSLLIVSLLFLSSCEFVNSFGENMGEFVGEVVKAPRDITNEFLGNDSQKLSRELKEANKRLSEVEQQNRLQDMLIELMSQDINDVNVDLSIIYDMFDNIQDNIDNMSDSIDTIERKIRHLRRLIQRKATKVVELCGDQGNDEVLIQVSDGGLIGYFEVRGKRFLAELTDGRYRTSDGYNCNFIIRNGKLIQE